MWITELQLAKVLILVCQCFCAYMLPSTTHCFNTILSYTSPDYQTYFNWQPWTSTVRQPISTHAHGFFLISWLTSISKYHSMLFPFNYPLSLFFCPCRTFCFVLVCFCFLFVCGSRRKFFFLSNYPSVIIIFIQSSLGCSLWNSRVPTLIDNIGNSSWQNKRLVFTTLISLLVSRSFIFPLCHFLESSFLVLMQNIVELANK